MDGTSESPWPVSPYRLREVQECDGYKEAMIAREHETRNWEIGEIQSLDMVWHLCNGEDKVGRYPSFVDTQHCVRCKTKRKKKKNRVEFISLYTGNHKR